MRRCIFTPVDVCYRGRVGFSRASFGNTSARLWGHLEEENNEEEHSGADVISGSVGDHLTLIGGT